MFFVFVDEFDSRRRQALGELNFGIERTMLDRVRKGRLNLERLRRGALKIGIVGLVFVDLAV